MKRLVIIVLVLALITISLKPTILQNVLATLSQEQLLQNADFNEDGTISLKDFEIWRTFFGQKTTTTLPLTPQPTNVIANPTAGLTPILDANKSLYISSISPSSGPVKSEVTLKGLGFTPNGNTVNFISPDNLESSMPYLTSSDSVTLSFKVPEFHTPMCVYTGPCPIAYQPTPQGVAIVSVTNANGTSNKITFTVTP